MTGHWYESTACQHGLHEQCRRTCKFCAVSCRCRCHSPNVVALPEPPPLRVSEARRELVGVAAS